MNYLLVFILVFCFVIRVVNLTSLPIFTDEAIYIRWTQIANGDPAWRFISLTDGKQPLFIWLNMISQRIFTEPLFAGRFVSVIAGIFTSLGLYFLGKELFSKKIGLWASFIWAILPFAVWHDRLALMDSLLACFAGWSFLLQILLIKKRQTDLALFLGMIIGLGLLTKSSAEFFIYLLPCSLILGNIDFSQKKFFFRWFVLTILAVFISQIINSIQRLSPFFYIVAQKNLTFIYSFDELLSFSLGQHWQRFWGNFYSLTLWSVGYITLPLIFLLIISILAIKEKWREKLLLIIWFLLPFIALSFFAKVIYPRFVLFMVVPLVILIADGVKIIFQKFRSKQFLLFTFYFLLFAYPVYFTSQIIFNPVNSPLPWVDRGQYLDDWPAGWGIKEVVTFLKQKSITEKIAVGTEGTFGLTPFALEIYLKDNKNVEIQGFWPITNGISWLEQKAQEKTTYLVLKDTQIPDASWPLELVGKYKRGKGNNYLGFYKVIKK